MTRLDAPEYVLEAIRDNPDLPLFKAIKLIDPKRLRYVGQPPRKIERESLTVWYLDGKRADHAMMMRAAGLPEKLGVGGDKGVAVKRRTA